MDHTMSHRQRKAMESAKWKYRAANMCATLDMSKGAPKAIEAARSMEVVKRGQASVQCLAHYVDELTDAPRVALARDISAMREWKIDGRRIMPSERMDAKTLATIPASVRADVRIQSRADTMERRGATRNGRAVGPIMAPKHHTRPNNGVLPAR